MISHPDHAHWRHGTATDRLFILAVIVKGLDGVFGIAGGVALAFVKPSTLDWIARVLTTHELSRNPHNIVAQWLIHSLGALDVSRLEFASVYLLIHGALKTFLVIMLLIGRPWSYPAGIGFLGIFVGYTLYRLTLHWSWILFGFALFDLFTIFLVAREWRIQWAHGFRPVSPPRA